MDRLLFKATQTGQKLEMIYLDADDNITYRVVRILSIKADTINAYCYSRRHIRTFKRTNILSVGPVRKKGIGA
ncbi:MAG TPA: hypothetical protein VK097_04895 [Lentibacillus sp.]|uniref:hypothetical protein n=1 Tax=Lentibacillus sp. TaxID=1925746 RepID=UPI002B4B1074|nr:hypothetical protein [Lentibacillus sp.]HLR61761.1 hypothetical protein [Lentibacillus sp.]